MTVVVFKSFICLAQDDEDFDFGKEFQKTANLIAMLKVDFEGTPEFGAGIIFGREKDRLLVATAFHVIHRGNINPTKIFVTFRFLPGKLIEAKLLKYNNENDMDLAVLTVDNISQKGINVCNLPFDRLGTTSDLERGDDVYAVGNPNGVAWAIPVAPDKISQITGKQIVFQSNFISSGHSGGGLLDDSAKLIGMTTGDQPPYGRAINIGVILHLAKQWNYPVRLYAALKDGGTALHLAVDNGEFASVLALLDECGGANAMDNHKATPLHFAAKQRNLYILNALIKAGSNINALDADGDAPLEWAIEKGRLENVKFLVNSGANINYKNYYKRTLLDIAARHQQTEIVNFLIAKGAIVNPSNDVAGTSALAEAVKSENLVMVRNLMTAYADVNVSLLKEPIERNNIELIKLLLTKVNNLNAKLYQSDETLLHVAVENNRLEIVKLLVNSGASINPKGYLNKTPLFVAFENKDTAIQNYLISHGADVKGVDEIRRESLMLDAVENKNLTIVQFLLNAGTNPDRTGLRALTKDLLEIAVTGQDIEIVRALVKAGANLKGSGHGTTPLLIAIDKKNTTITKILIEGGADIFETGGGGYTESIEKAISKDDIEIVKILITSKTVINQLDKVAGYAAFAGKSDILKLLISKGASAQKVWIPAIKLGQVPIIELLLKAGIRVNDDLENGEKPLHMAVKENKIESVKALLRAGANVNAKGNDFDTPFAEAVGEGNIEIIKLLIAAGVNVNEKRKEPYLHLAATNQFNRLNTVTEVVSVLLANKADVNVENDNRETPLVAVLKEYRPNTEMIKILLKASAKVNVKDAFGETALHLIVHSNPDNVIEIVKLLLDAGADINAKNSDGITPLKIAIDEGHEKISTYLISRGAK